MLRVRALTVGLVAVGCCVGAAEAWGTVTPGWECIPTTAGQPVISGGTSATPACGAGTTPVLAPTYVASGVGGKPTVEFNAINVQVISGTGLTNGTPNGEGNLIVGYAENPSGFSRTGSNDLVVGYNNGWTSFGQLVGGATNSATSPFATVFGVANSASGVGSLVAGDANHATGTESSVLGGKGNTSGGSWSSVLGGSARHATGSCQSIPATNTC